MKLVFRIRIILTRSIRLNFEQFAPAIELLTREADLIVLDYIPGLDVTGGALDYIQWIGRHRDTIIPVVEDRHKVDEAQLNKSNHLLLVPTYSHFPEVDGEHTIREAVKEGAFREQRSQLVLPRVNASKAPIKFLASGELILKNYIALEIQNWMIETIGLLPVSKSKRRTQTAEIHVSRGSLVDQLPEKRHEFAASEWSQVVTTKCVDFSDCKDVDLVSERFTDEDLCTYPTVVPFQHIPFYGNVDRSIHFAVATPGIGYRSSGYLNPLHIFVVSQEFYQRFKKFQCKGIRFLPLLSSGDAYFQQFAALDQIASHAAISTK